VTNHDDAEQDRLRELNEQLNESIDRCRSILKDCRNRLANDPTEVPPAEHGPSPE
jgi:hypothetical protein